jgi:hypothetical protein
VTERGLVSGRGLGSDVSSLPVLVHEVGQTVTCTAVARRVGDRMMLALPFQAGFGPSRGRRYRITIDGRRSGSQLVMVVNEQAMVPLPAGLCTDGDQAQVTLRVLSQRPALRVPADLAAALEQAGVALDLVEEHELNQLVTMIREADDPTVRSGRVQNAVAAIAEMTAARISHDDDG